MEKEKNSEQTKENYYGVGNFVSEIIKIVILAVIIIIPVRVFLFQPFLVQGSSMFPTFKNNEYLIINEVGYKETSANIGDKNFFKLSAFKDLERQEVIVFHYPKDEKQFFIKRVVGLPGERVEIKDGIVTIYNKENPNGLQLDESAYLSSGVITKGELSINLKSDEYFVMGDNRMASSDSRTWGPVRKSDIVGTVVLRAWPFDRINKF